MGFDDIKYARTYNLHSAVNTTKPDGNKLKPVHVAQAPTVQTSRLL